MILPAPAVRDPAQRLKERKMTQGLGGTVAYGVVSAGGVFTQAKKPLSTKAALAFETYEERHLLG